MPNAPNSNFYFLNTEGLWPGFVLSGLELCPDGAVQLASLPSLSATLPGAVSTAPVPDGPAGIAIDSTGTIYFSDPEGNCVRRILGCDGSASLTPCMGGSADPTGFRTPRGLFVSPVRSSLFIADSGNHRLQVFDLESFQLSEIWGQSNPAGIPQPGSLPGQLNTPWALAGDSSGNVYVVDYGNKRVQKFNVLGQVVPTFCQNVQASGRLHQPADIAVLEINGEVWIFVVDLYGATIYVFGADGHPLVDASGNPRIINDAHLTKPMGIAAEGNVLYVGDNASMSILCFHVADAIAYTGQAIGYAGPVAALLAGPKCGLLVNPGHSLSLVALKTTQGHATLGALWLAPGSPLQVPNRSVVWHRLQSLARNLPPAAHLDVLAYASNNLSDAPAVDPSAADPFSDKKWKPANYPPGIDITDVFIGGPKLKYLWVGALLSGDGSVTPRLTQLRVEYDHTTYDQYLPAIYRNTEKNCCPTPPGPSADQATCAQFLVRLLSLFESFFAGVQHEIGGLPALFDPYAVRPSFLAWLAGCLGFDLDSNWDEETQRRITAEIFRLSGLRGTPAGLRESLRLFAGVDAIIQEPILNTSWWALPSSSGTCCQSCAEAASASGPSWSGGENSLLGWTTMLTPAQPAGAVVGSSADLDQSHLIADEDFGLPLFSDVAYQFSVEVYRSQVIAPGAIARVQAIVDQEKPAHTAYEICVIDPLFRVGFQSRVGIDTVVSGPPRSLALGTGQKLGSDAALAGPPPSLLGAGSRLGISTRLG
jgi:phage tail-like protein